MLDIKWIRDNTNVVKEALAKKGVQVDLAHLLNLDQERRGYLVKLDDLRNQKNAANDEIAQLLRVKGDPKDKIAGTKIFSSQISELEPKLKAIENQISDILIYLPNLPHESVPVGGVAENQLIRSWEDPKPLDFKPKTHTEIAEYLDIVDFKRATKISGSNFVVFKKEGARLERALYNFMLDLHISEHGYQEISPPFLVNRLSMIGTGQLPKMEEDMYKLKDDDYFLIPTAEVPITNLYREEIIKEEDLPIYYTAYTACFRREAGSYGKDTKGLMRVHQFDKVELVKFVKPETSYDELERLVGDAEKVLQLLGLPYRVMLLATSELSFSAAKCYDIEIYCAGAGKWLEVSSCSNFEDFQARRANIRFKGKSMKKPLFVHTLNGSGVALARTVIAILENYQNNEGEVMIPEVLQTYMNGQRKISKG